MCEMNKPRTLALLCASMFLCACVDHTKQTEARMKSESTQKVTALTEADQERLKDQRAVIEKFLPDESSRQNYKKAAGKLGIIRAILDRNLLKPTQTYELQCLGIVLGDVFVQELKMEWVMVEDERGRDPAVRLPKTSIIMFPLTMISKRIERGEKVDVFDLFNGVAAKVEEMQRQGY